MSSQLDRYYTPTWLAEYLAGLLPAGTTSVVDLAAGGGSLLDAASRRFGSIDISATDVDPHAVRHLRRQRPSWTVSQSDALSERSYKSCLAYSRFRSGHDAVLLNPPFSYRGQGRLLVTYAGVSYKVTPATAFVLRAFDWVADSGVIVAIVPENVMDVKGDYNLWSTWQSTLRMERKRALNRYTFQNARTATRVVVLYPSRPAVRKARRVSHVADISSTDDHAFADQSCRCVEIIRGRVPVHRSESVAASDGKPFVHTTALKSGKLAPTERLIRSDLASVGPLVLLPRVGMPSREKIVESAVSHLVLSDCVFGIRSLDLRTQAGLAQTMRDGFEDLAHLYGGSCAPYLTVEVLTAWLNRRGLNAKHVAPSSQPGWCDCAYSVRAAPA